MIYKLAKPVRQLLAIVLLVVTIAAAAALTVVPVWSRVTELQDNIETERMTLGRLQAITSGETKTSDIERLTKAAREQGIFLAGESESIRFANLQSQLNEIVSAYGVKPRSTRNLPAREHNDLRLLGVQLQIVAPIEQLQKILFDIEQHKPILMIDAVQIIPLSLPGGGNDEDRGAVDARFDVFGVESHQKGG